jgi:hypothetical protein
MVLWIFNAKAQKKFGICTETDSSRFHARRLGALDF